MAFVTRIRLLQVASGTPEAPTAITPTVFRTGPTGTVAWTVADAMLIVPAGQRPPQADWWQYALQWEVQSSCVPHIQGVVADTGRLVFDVDLWDTATARLAAPAAPQRRNTFVHEFTTKRLAGAGPEIVAAIDDYVLRATMNNYPADGRAAVAGVTTDPARDPLGLLARPAITGKDGVPNDRDPRWRSMEG